MREPDADAIVARARLPAVRDLGRAARGRPLHDPEGEGAPPPAAVDPLRVAHPAHPACPAAHGRDAVPGVLVPHPRPQLREGRGGVDGEDLPGARLLPGQGQLGREAVAPVRGALLRGRARRRGAPGPRVRRLPHRLRPVRTAHEHDLPRPGRPQQPLQPDLPGVLREREPGGLPRRSRPSRRWSGCCGRCATRSRCRRRPCSSRGASRRCTRSSSASSAAAREMGFTHVQCATNGVTLAEPGFAEKAAAAGLQTAYLQFDGTDDSIYRKLRGAPLMETKRAAVEACRRAGIRVVPRADPGQGRERRPGRARSSASRSRTPT